jgi:hypothetical protein
MLLAIHIISALTGLTIAGLGYLRPSRTMLSLSIGLSVVVLGTGTYLVWTHPSHLASSVITGFVYFALMTAAIVGSARKLGVRAESD